MGSTTSRCVTVPRVPRCCQLFTLPGLSMPFPNTILYSEQPQPPSTPSRRSLTRGSDDDDQLLQFTFTIRDLTFTKAGVPRRGVGGAAFKAIVSVGYAPRMEFAPTKASKGGTDGNGAVVVRLRHRRCLCLRSAAAHCGYVCPSPIPCQSYLSVYISIAQVWVGHTGCASVAFSIASGLMASSRLTIWQTFFLVLLTIRRGKMSEIRQLVRPRAANSCGRPRGSSDCCDCCGKIRQIVIQIL